MIISREGSFVKIDKTCDILWVLSNKYSLRSMEQKENGLNINMPTAIVIVGILIAGAIIFTNSPRNKISDIDADKQIVDVSQQINVAPVTDQDHFYGNPKAKVVMIEFSDTECPFCKSFHGVAKKVVDESRGEVAWVYRHFPIDSRHPKARKEAEATECAAELGGNDKFWEYVDALFAITPSNNGLDPAELPKLAARVGLNVDNFNACLSSGKYKDGVETNYQDGLKAGVDRTPTTVLINQKGEKMILVGALPEAQIRAVIDKLK